jgi:hydroxysqualene synthase
MSATERVTDLASGKGHRDENFPVASMLIHPRHRDLILAFYRFARAADDVADNADAKPADKLALLEAMRVTVAGEAETDAVSVALRAALSVRGLTPRHPLDLLEAFRRDVTKRRYANWAELMDYCRYSAAPVGRFMLDVHDEAETTWPANDALCAALQVINHLQDCGKDRAQIDRVYVPEDALAAAGLDVTALDAPQASAALRGVIAGLAQQTQTLLAQSRLFAGQIRDGRLAMEVSVIQRLAESLAQRLTARDPLSQRVHHGKAEALGLALLAAGGLAGRRAFGLGR